MNVHSVAPAWVAFCGAVLLVANLVLVLVLAAAHFDPLCCALGVSTWVAVLPSFPLMACSTSGLLLLYPVLTTELVYPQLHSSFILARNLFCRVVAACTARSGMELILL